MSKRSKKRNKKLPLTAIALTAASMLLFLAAMVFTGRDREQPEYVDGTPALAVDQREIDFGDVKFNTEKTFSIRVTNNGDGTLRFKEEPYIRVLEGC